MGVQPVHRKIANNLNILLIIVKPVLWL